MTLPHDWANSRFNQLGTLYSGSTPSTTNLSYWGGDIVWVTPNDLSKLNTPYLNDSAKRITDKGLRGCSATLLPPGSIVISSRAPIGYAAIPKVEFCTNQGCKSIDLRDSFDSEYTYYSVLFNVAKLKRLGEGTTFSEISKTALALVELAFPNSKLEQTKIAKVLSTVDRAIEQMEALIAKQQRIKTGLMQDLLTRGIDEHGNLRSEETHEFKDSSLKGTRIPYIWTDGDFRKVTSVNQGLQIPIEKRFKEEDSNRHKYITVQHINNPDKYLEYIEKPPPQLVCKKDDILFTRTGNTGQIITGIEGVYHNNFFKVAYDKTKANGDYLVQFLNWQPIQELIRERAGTTTIPDLNHGDFYSLPFFLPDLNEQKLISSILGGHSAALGMETSTLHKLHSLKTALMQDLLTGKVRVTTLLKKAEKRV